MNISPSIGSALMMSNYFHDVATALPLSCGIVMYLILRRQKNASNPDVKDFVIRVYLGVRKILVFSLFWIILAGIPRLLTIKSFEWANAVEKHHEQGLIAKYIIAIVIMIAAAFVWLSIEGKIKKIKDTR